MFNRFLKKWVPEPGTTRIGQYLLVLVILVALSLFIGEKYGPEVPIKIREAFLSVVAGF